MSLCNTHTDGFGMETKATFKNWHNNSYYKVKVNWLQFSLGDGDIL